MTTFHSDFLETIYKNTVSLSREVCYQEIITDLHNILTHTSTYSERTGAIRDILDKYNQKIKFQK